MLAKVNRLVTADDYRRLVRRGRRIQTAHVLIYVVNTGLAAPPRFGFIVAKSVGMATQRNLVRRRLKAITFEHVVLLNPGIEIVIRALPGSASAAWLTLYSDIYRALGAA